MSGHRPDFAALQHHPAHQLELPTYPFQRRPSGPDVGISLDGPTVSGILGSAGDPPPATRSTPADCPSSRSPGWRTMSSTAPSSSPGRRTRRWRWPPPVRWPASGRLLHEPIILPEKTSREVQLTLHPLADGGGRPSRCTAARTGSRRRLVAERRGHAGTGRRRRRAQRNRRIPSTRPSSGWNACVRRNCSRRSPTWNSPGAELVGALAEVVVARRGRGDRRHRGRRGARRTAGTEPMHPVLLDLCTGVAFRPSRHCGRPNRGA